MIAALLMFSTVMINLSHAVRRVFTLYTVNYIKRILVQIENQTRKYIGKMPACILPCRLLSAHDRISPSFKESDHENNTQIYNTCHLPAPYHAERLRQLAQSATATGRNPRRSGSAPGPADQCLPAGHGPGAGIRQRPLGPNHLYGALRP